MSKLSDLFKSKDRTVDALTPSETALHALTVDDDGLLTYTKVLWNSEETVDMTDGSGFAYLGVEELVDGFSMSNTFHNLIGRDYDEVGEKNIINVTFRLTSTNGQYIVDGNTMPAIRMTRGVTYTFIVEDPSTNGYPLYISTQAAGNNYGNIYQVGVANSKTEYGGILEGPLVFTVPMNAPDTLYYASGNHANCYGKISIDDRDELTNLNNRKYDQVRFDNQKLTYYMNDDGFLVARYGQDYNYS
jgi:hypothetical protein